MSQRSNYHDKASTGRVGSPDAQGQAALLLAESILHGLLEKGVLGNDDAIAMVTSAIEIKEQLIANGDEPAAIGNQSVGLLSRIAASLELDQPDNGAAIS